MPRRKEGSRQKAVFSELMRGQTGNELYPTLARARSNANATGGTTTRELRRLEARGDANATTILSAMKAGGASTGGSGG